LGGLDRADVYRFELLEPAVVDVELIGLTRNVDLTLLDFEGRRLADSRNGGSRSESLSILLEPGEYFVALDMLSLGTTPYALRLAASVPGDADPFLGVIDNQFIRIEGALDARDRTDEFSFELLLASDFTLTLAELTGDAEVELIDLIDGRVIAESRTFGRRPHVIEDVLAPGLYSVRVTQLGHQPVAYELSLFAPTHVGDTPETALDLGVVRSNAPLSALMGPIAPVGLLLPPAIPLVSVLQGVPISSLPPLRDAAPLIASSETFTPSGLPTAAFGFSTSETFGPFFGTVLTVLIEGTSE
jgi:hypothetical protein